MSKIIERYCKRCGKELIEEIKWYHDWFDVQTGNPVVTRNQVCLNAACPIGCENLGHVWGKFWKFQNWEKCQRCGAAMYSY